MHRGHDNDHDHESGASISAVAGVGHNQVNAPARPVQWQVLHSNPEPAVDKAVGAVADLDLVEAAFVEGFLAASDPTSFLRLAGAPSGGLDHPLRACDAGAAMMGFEFRNSARSTESAPAES